MSIVNSGFLGATLLLLLATSSGLSHEPLLHVPVERIQADGAQSVQEPQARRVPVDFQPSHSEQRWVF
ncbi:hypothetical protein DNJ96_03315 [Stutzerimonas kirkiae]|uniref:Uncharacterized protein n=1 Tax=Stutzerimonas kirkiae TaxID=2211392 RepID=A0A4Q9RFA2_9GAMM|nr:hypothetical protein DNJ96_03315 [Stutzerimonas kirkiae]TBV04468.1 hypothetical protein DNK08_16835 [Stutzerimonas kirkiae]TBV11901.1 hypothetical protein DNK01_15740 [Stutzerimonas kirkiae]